ncbi:hypothetical protein [Lacticaseibacillus sp. N501-2]|uniref:hypothetical protein n=1 Tax=Lacticaseibacillus salsurae TaxID=3367729 RepID=UPI0038B3ED9F
MNGSTAFHLKQIMSAEHLSVTQAAKQIGISPVSMRKVLKDVKMSTAVMFKINRFIDEHESIIATKPGELPTDTQAGKKADDKSTAKKPSSKRNRNNANEKAAAQKPAAKQPAKANAKNQPKKTANASTKQTNTKRTNTKAAAPKADTKAPAQKQSAGKKATQTRANKAKAATKTQPKPAEKPAAQPAQATTPAKPAKVTRKQQPARFTIHQTDGAPIQSEAEHEAQRIAEASAVEARAEQLSQAGVGSMNPNAQVPAHHLAKTPAVQPKPVAKAPAEPKPAVAQKPATEAKPAAAPKPTAPQKPATTTATAEKPAVQPKPQAKPAAKAEPQKAPAKSVAKAVAAKPTAKAQAEAKLEETQTTPAQPVAQKPQAQPVAAEAKAPVAKKHPQTLQLFIDESFVHGNDYQRNMFIGATLVDQDDDHALDQFANTLYPFGWQPGDEVKARGKSHEQIAAMLTQAHGDQAQNFVTYSPQSDMGNFAMGFGIWYPYLATVLRVLDTLDYLPNKVRIALDRRNEFEDEQLAVAARMLNAYVKAQSGKDVMFMLRTSDSKSTIGIQYSDFSAHAALTFTKEQLAECGITRLEDLGSQIGDQITLFSMIGLQKYMLDDRSVVKQQASFKNPVLVAAERLYRLANKATNLSLVPDETLTQAKLVINQLLQVCPSAITGAINKMPFQTWYDMVARAAALLHYTDETLPSFDIDPDAMQIAQDALNNIANLLATAR